MLAGIAAYAGYALYRENGALRASVVSLTSSLASSEKNVDELRHDREILSDALSAEKTASGYLKEQATSFAAAVQKLTGRVTTLDKLTKLDPELLIKYSKVYFLNENYIPAKLIRIPKERVYNGKEEYMEGTVVRFLEDLLKEAQAAGNELSVISAFRSFETQKDLKNKYVVTYGAGANTFSAEQGYSEHQLGTTVDFTTPELGANFSTFDRTSGFAWLENNAHRFGFTLSYPKGNNYYIYEPWHWRFIGVELATKLHAGRAHFYDMGQREINEYLVKIFD